VNDLYRRLLQLFTLNVERGNATSYYIRKLTLIVLANGTRNCCNRDRKFNGFGERSDSRVSQGKTDRVG